MSELTIETVAMIEGERYNFQKDLGIVRIYEHCQEEVCAVVHSKTNKVLGFIEIEPHFGEGGGGSFRYNVPESKKF